MVNLLLSKIKMIRTFEQDLVRAYALKCLMAIALAAQSPPIIIKP
jgi:hypothetical protein